MSEISEIQLAVVEKLLKASTREQRMAGMKELGECSTKQADYKIWATP